MKNFVIYKVTNPLGNSYIGKAADWPDRYRHYKNLDCKLQKHLYRSFLKYGFENHTFEILMQNIPEKYLNGLEMMYIWAFDTFRNPKHLNLTEGGEGSFGRIMTEETKRKISRPLSKETKEKISRAKKGQRVAEETKKKISESTKGNKNHNFGKKFSEQTLNKMKRPKTEEHKNKLRKPKSAEHIKKIIENHADFSGDKNPNFGKKHSAQTKKKMSEIKIGKKHSAQTIKKQSEIKMGSNNPMFGRTLSAETKQKIKDTLARNKSSNKKKNILES